MIEGFLNEVYQADTVAQIHVHTFTWDCSYVYDAWSCSLLLVYTHPQSQLTMCTHACATVPAWHTSFKKKLDMNIASFDNCIKLWDYCA